MFDVNSDLDTVVSSCTLLFHVLDLTRTSQPLSYYYVRFDTVKRVTSGTCYGDQTLAPIIANALNVLGDILVLVLPLHILRNLQMGVKKKITLISLFCCGTMYVSFSYRSLLALLTKVIQSVWSWYSETSVYCSASISPLGSHMYESLLICPDQLE